MIVQDYSQPHQLALSPLAGLESRTFQIPGNTGSLTAGETPRIDAIAGTKRHRKRRSQRTPMHPIHMQGTSAVTPQGVVPGPVGGFGTVTKDGLVIDTWPQRGAEVSVITSNASSSCTSVHSSRAPNKSIDAAGSGKNCFGLCVTRRVGRKPESRSAVHPQESWIESRQQHSNSYLDSICSSARNRGSNVTAASGQHQITPHHESADQIMPGAGPSIGKYHDTMDGHGVNTMLAAHEVSSSTAEEEATAIEKMLAPSPRSASMMPGRTVEFTDIRAGGRRTRSTVGRPARSACCSCREQPKAREFKLSPMDDISESDDAGSVARAADLLPDLGGGTPDTMNPPTYPIRDMPAHDGIAPHLAQSHDVPNSAGIRPERNPRDICCNVRSSEKHHQHVASHLIAVNNAPIALAMSQPVTSATPSPLMPQSTNNTKSTIGDGHQHRATAVVRAVGSDATSLVPITSAAIIGSEQSTMAGVELPQIVVNHVPIATTTTEARTALTPMVPTVEQHPVPIYPMPAVMTPGTTFVGAGSVVTVTGDQQITTTTMVPAVQQYPTQINTVFAAKTPDEELNISTTMMTNAEQPPVVVNTTSTVGEQTTTVTAVTTEQPRSCPDTIPAVAITDMEQTTTITIDEPPHTFIVSGVPPNLDGTHSPPATIGMAASLASQPIVATTEIVDSISIAATTKHEPPPPPPSVPFYSLTPTVPVNLKPSPLSLGNVSGPSISMGPPRLPASSVPIAPSNTGSSIITSQPPATSDVGVRSIPDDIIPGPGSAVTAAVTPTAFPDAYRPITGSASPQIHESIARRRSFSTPVSAGRHDIYRTVHLPSPTTSNPIASSSVPGPAGGIAAITVTHPPQNGGDHEILRHRSQSQPPMGWASAPITCEVSMTSRHISTQVIGTERILEHRTVANKVICSEATENVSLAERFGAENIGHDELGEFVIRRIEVKKYEVIDKTIPKKEVRETVVEKKVPQTEWKEVIVEVPQIRVVPKEVPVDQIQEVVVHKPVKQVVERQVEVLKHVQKVQVVEKIVTKEVPGEIIEVPKRYIVERPVIIPKFLDRKVPCVVAQSFRPIVVEADYNDPTCYIDVACRVFQFQTIPRDVYIPLCVPRALIFSKMQVQHKEVMPHLVPDEQHNSLVRALNPSLGIDHADDLLRFVLTEPRGGANCLYWQSPDQRFLPLLEGVEVVEPKYDMQFVGTASTAVSSVECKAASITGSGSAGAFNFPTSATLPKIEESVPLGHPVYAAVDASKFAQIDTDLDAVPASLRATARFGYQSSMETVPHLPQTKEFGDATPPAVGPQVAIGPTDLTPYATLSNVYTTLHHAGTQPLPMNPFTSSALFATAIQAGVGPSSHPQITPSVGHSAKGDHMRDSSVDSTNRRSILMDTVQPSASRPAWEVAATGVHMRAFTEWSSRRTDAYSTDTTSLSQIQLMRGRTKRGRNSNCRHVATAPTATRRVSKRSLSSVDDQFSASSVASVSVQSPADYLAEIADLVEAVERKQKRGNCRPEQPGRALMATAAHHSSGVTTRSFRGHRQTSNSRHQKPHAIWNVKKKPTSGSDVDVMPFCARRRARL